MENNKNNVLLTVIGVATLLVAIVGASFAYFSASGGTATQNVKTGALKISAVAGAVNQANIKPVDAEDIATMDDKLSHTDVVKLPITVNTTGTTISGEYNMYLDASGLKLNTAAGEGGSLSDIRWELVKEGATTAMASGNFAGANADGDITKMALNTTAIPVPSSTTDDVTTYGGTENYNLLIYINNTNDTVEGNGDGVQDQLQGLQITAFVTVEAIQTPNE